MKPLVRISALLTAMGGLLFGVSIPPLGRAAVTAPVVLESTLFPDDLSPTLPDGWPPRIAAHLSKRHLSIEAGELLRVLQVVAATSERFGVDPLTVLAVIDVESGFNPYAVSPVGAVGLMQLRAETACEIAEQLGIPWTSDDLLFEPETNVLLGTFYLQQLLDRFGSVELALAAFHVGPSRIASRNLQLGSASRAFTGRVWNALRELHETSHV